MRRISAFLVLGALFLSALCADSAVQAGIMVPGQNITVDGTATYTGTVWEYRYTITDTLGGAVSPVRFIVSEHPTHAGLHHEFNFLNDGGAFQYDFPVPAPFVGISPHNYFWNDLDVPANASIVIGFDDVHGPSLVTWGIQARGQHVELANLLPAPAIPEPGSLAVCCWALVGFYILRRRTGVGELMSNRQTQSPCQSRKGGPPHRGTAIPFPAPS